MKALGIACGIVFWTLVLGTAFLWFFPGGDGEPVAILQIEPAPAPSPDGAASAPEAQAPAPTPAPAPSAESAPDLPPGFAVGPPDSPQAPSEPQGGPMMPIPQGQSEPPAEPAQPGPDDAAPPSAPDQQGAAPGAEMQRG